MTADFKEKGEQTVDPPNECHRSADPKRDCPGEKCIWRIPSSTVPD